MQERKSYRIFAIFVLMSTILSINTYAQVVHFPDPNLRAAIVEAIGANPDRITVVALRRLERLDAGNSEIESLEGLQHATNLRLLDLANNRISDLTPLANLHSLEELGLDRNVIKDVSPLAGLVNLLVLTIEFNQITDIEPLRGLTNLRTLTIEGNFIVDYSPLDGLLIAHFTNDQVVHFPDPNLRAVVAEHLGVDPDRITVVALRRLERFGAPHREIENLEGLQHSPNLRLLNLDANLISDLTPLASLRNLEELELSWNNIRDISPLAKLTNLQVLTIRDNLITDVESLRGLTNLRALLIQSNFIVDHTPLDGLSIENLQYDQICAMPPVPVEPRLEDRRFPSVFAAWAGILNAPHLSWVEQISRHDLYFAGLTFDHEMFDTGSEWVVRGATRQSMEIRDDYFTRNPNMLFLVKVAMRDSPLGRVPEESPHWPYFIRDGNGEPVPDPAWPGSYLLDFTQPGLQDLIVQLAVGVSKCGLYDGIFFDWWAEDGPVLDIYVGLQAELQARENILKRIRALTHPDFLIMVNTNDRKIPRTGKYINGSFMETLTPRDVTGDLLEQRISRIEDSLLWLDTNLREPRINGLEGWSVPTEPPDSPTNLRWMRFFTTLSLTHSDGYVLFNDGVSHAHYWYDFWDADLGRPLSEAKAQLYENREGLYIREFTHGWAVYNHSGEPQVITLPQEAQGVASGLVNTEHALPNLDGEMYLRMKPKNPADVNGDGIVNILDLILVAQGFGTNETEADVNGDGVVNVFDLVFVANQF